MQTRWDDTDIYGHLNNTVHYRLFDSALTIWLIENDLTDPAKGDVITLVVSTGCSFFAELTFPQAVTAGMRAERIGRTSISYTFGLFQGGDRAAAQGHLTHVLVDRSTRAPRPITEIWLRALDSIKAPDAHPIPNENSKSTQQRETTS
ncbi:MAG: thioesterase family protein [Pseudomonadota bacterium]